MDIQTLRRFEILVRLDDETLAEFFSALEEQCFEEGETIFQEGEVGAAIYFITEGVVGIEKRMEETKLVLKTLAVLSAGDFFGEMAVLDKQLHSASAVARMRVKTFKLSRQVLDDLLQKGSRAGISFLYGMVHTFSERTRWSNTCLVVYDEVGTAIGEGAGLQRLLDTVISLLHQAIEADWSLLLLRPASSDHLEVRSSEQIELSSCQLDQISEGSGILGFITKHPESLLIGNFEEDTRFKDLERLSFESVAMIMIPIVAGEDFLGLIISGHPTADHFDLNHQNLCQGVAHQAAQAILNSRHREEEASRSRKGRKFVRF